MKNITYLQAIVLLGCLAAPIVAYKLLGSVEAGLATSMVGMVLNFFMGRNDPPPPDSGSGSGGGGSNLKIVAGGMSALLLLAALPGCKAFLQDAKYFLDAAQVACAIAHAETDDSTVAQICGVSDALIPDLKKLLEAQRAAVAKAKHDAACRTGASAK